MFWWKIYLEIIPVKKSLLNQIIQDTNILGIEEPDSKTYITYYDSSIEFGELETFFIALQKKDNLIQSFTIEKQYQENWQENWKQHFNPVKIQQKFIIGAPWHQLPDDLPQIIIEPNLAFGTGTHETTQIVLQLLNQQIAKGKKVLDIGCGSGILSFAASILGAEEVTGIDIDPVAVEYANKNLSQYNPQLTNVQFFNKDTRQLRQNYDLVLINIISSKQKKIFPITNYLLPKSKIISSGILTGEIDDYLEFIQHSGHKAIKTHEINEWAGFILQ